MHHTAALVSAWLLATAGLIQARALGSHDWQKGALLPRTANTTTAGNITMGENREARYDQMLFFQCSRGNSGGRIMAYYDHPPNWPNKPTQVAFKEVGGSWGNGCKSIGRSTDGAEWSCDIDAYTYDERRFQSFVGSTTYGFTGFNCFMDDGHPVFLESGEYGMCYAELYCTHQRATSLQIDASRDVVQVLHRATAIDGKKAPNLPSGDAKAIVRSYLGQARQRIRGQQCDPTLVQLSPDCKMQVKCRAGEHSYLEKLGDTLVAVYEEGVSDMFKLIDTKDRTPQSPICDPFTNKCRQQPDVCDYIKGVEMPARYVLSLADRAPPRSGEKSYPMGDIDVEIQCSSRRNDAMCDAMSKLLWGMGLYGPISGLFSVGSLGIKAGCM